MTAPVVDQRGLEEASEEQLLATLEARRPGSTLALRNAQTGAVAGVEQGPPREVSIAEVLHFAIATKLPASELRELVALQVQMEKRSAEKQFFDAMALLKGELGPIKKRKTANIATTSGGSFAYTYAPLDDIARALDPLCTKHGFSYTWDTVETKDTVTAVCIVRHKAGHSERSSFSVPAESKSGASPQQKVGIAATYAQRRSLSNAFGLTSTDEDNDAASIQRISEAQAEELAAMVTKAVEGKPEEKAERFRARFLGYMGVEFLADIKLADYKKACAALKTATEAKPAPAAAGSAT